MLEAIQAYLIRQLPKRDDFFECGPFSIGLSRESDNPYLNYAVPRIGVDATDVEVQDLVRAFQSRGRKPRLEYIPGWAPKVEAALLHGGFAEESRTPLMVCRKIDLDIPNPPPGISVRTPKKETEVREMLIVQNQAFGAGPPTTSEVVKLQRRIWDGQIVRMAIELGSKRVVGGGSCTDPDGGTVEVVGIGVSPESRGKGVGCHLTAKLAEAAFQNRVNVCFLMAATEREARIYSRVGFKPVGEVLHISL